MSTDTPQTSEPPAVAPDQELTLADVEAVDGRLEAGTTLALQLADGAVVVARVTQLQRGRHECPAAGCFRRFDSVRGRKGHVTKQHPEVRAAEAQECPECGVAFRPDPANEDQQFCSSSCYHDSRADRVTLTCGHCGDEFEAKPSHADGRDHCSMDCRRAADAWPVGNAKKVVREVRDCPECGDTFPVPPSHADQQYCSQDCYSASRWETRECEMCGGAFEARRVDDDRYCARGCHFEDARKYPRPADEQARLADILLGGYERASTLNRVRAHLGPDLSDDEALATLAEAVLAALDRGRRVPVDRVADVRDATTLFELSRALRVERQPARLAAAALELELAEAATVVDERVQNAARRKLRAFIRDRGGEPSG